MATTTATAPRTTRSSVFPLLVLSLCGFTSVTTELMPAGLLTSIASDLGSGIIQIGIAVGAALGGLTVDTLGVAWVPLTGAIFAAGSAALLAGLRRFLPRRRSAAAG